jgi:Nuclease-related domain
MTMSPTLSPWPAPSLADAAPRDAGRQLAPTTEPQRAGAPTVEPRPHRHVAALLTTAKRLSSRSERAEYAAAKEEQRINDELDDLPAGWFVVRATDLGMLAEQGGEIDHVVIGPGGVFTIHLEHQAEAKVWVSEHNVTINGRDSDRLSRARFGARRAGGLLTALCGFDVTVQSVLVLIGAATVQTLSRPAEVHVRTQHDLRDWLCKQPRRLDAETVAAIHEHVNCASQAPSGTPAGLLE